MTSAKRSRKRPRKTSIVPRVVFQTVVAMSVVPVAGGIAAGCGGHGPATFDGGRDAGFFGVADAGPPPSDANVDAFFFSVAAPIDSGTDTGTFGVADVGPPPDSGFFSVAAPIDSGTFGVAAEPPDGSA